MVDFTSAALAMEWDGISDNVLFPNENTLNTSPAHTMQGAITVATWLK